MAIPIDLSVHLLEITVMKMMRNTTNQIFDHMKKALFTIAAGVALILAGCNKEADNAPEQKIGKTYTIKATVENPATRSVASLNESTDKYEFSWEEGESIGVIPDGDPTVLMFNLVEGSDDTFTYEAQPGDEYSSFGLAVTPYDALQPEEGEDFSYVDGADVNYYVTLGGSYVQGQSNAVMVAGAPETQGDGTQKFSFKHLAALVRVTYENIPEGVAFMEFTTPDHPITGLFHFTTVAGAQIVAGDFPAGESDPMGEAWVILPVYTGTIASADFYLPIPTGSYSTFNVRLVDEEMNTIPGSQKTFSTSSPFTVSRADVVECPKITLDAPETLAGEWIMVGEKDSDFYAAQAFESGNNLKGVSVDVSGNAVTSDDYIPVKMTFTYVSEGNYAGMYTIQDANGKYLYAASSSSNYLKADDAISTSNPQHYYWTITEEGNDVYSIVASKSGNHNVLRFNYNGGNTLFACYESKSTTGINVLLYKWADANIPNPTCATPEISCRNNVITITSATAGATIYYEIGADESVADPTTASSVYDPDNEPTISADSYVKAIAVAEGYNNSEVAGAAVTYKEPVVLAGWVRTDISDLNSGDEIVIVDLTSKNAMSNNNGTGSAPSAIAVTVADEKITSEVPSTIKWIFNSDSEKGYSFNVSGTSNYLYCTNTNNGVRVGTNDNRYFNFVLEGSKYFLKNVATSRYTSYNKSNSDWRCYTSVNTNIEDSEVAFFKYYDDGKQNAGISFTPASATITWGETLTQPTLNNEHGLTVTYASGNPEVASLNGSTIVVNKAGTATITASWTEQAIDGVTYRAGSTDFTLTVNKATPVVAFNNPTTTVYVGGSSVTNVASVTPNTLEVTYSSSDENVATVTSAGVVTGIADGTATITAAFAGNDNYVAASGSYEMTVVDNRTFAVTINQPQTGGTFKVEVDGSEISTNASVQVNKTVTLTAVPAEGNVLDAWTVTKTGDPTTVVTVNNDSFTMPAYAVTITASFKVAPQDHYYVKVTSTDDLTDGDYLIVYETSSVAFNGGLSTLDAVSNNISVTIDNQHRIKADATTNAAKFSIDLTDGTLQSASGLYIGVSANSNGLKQTDESDTYSNSFSIDDSGNAVISAVFTGSSMTLRFNDASNQDRFRYYKSGQKAIQLYKYVE